MSVCCVFWGPRSQWQGWLGRVAAVDITKPPVMSHSPALSHIMAPKHPDKRKRLEEGEEVGAGNTHPWHTPFTGPVQDGGPGVKWPLKGRII